MIRNIRSKINGDAGDVPKKNSPRTLAAAVADLPASTPTEPWRQDEMQLGQKNGLIPATGTQGHPPASFHGQRYESAYLFGAVCAACGTGGAIEMPRADTVAMQLHLEEISRAVAPGAHAVLLMGRAGWLIGGALDMPGNLTLFRHRLYGVYNFYNSDLTLLFFFEFEKSVKTHCKRSHGPVNKLSTQPWKTG